LYNYVFLRSHASWTVSYGNHGCTRLMARFHRCKWYTCYSSIDSIDSNQ